MKNFHVPSSLRPWTIPCSFHRSPTSQTKHITKGRLRFMFYIFLTNNRVATRCFTIFILLRTTINYPWQNEHSSIAIEPSNALGTITPCNVHSLPFYSFSLEEWSCSFFSFGLISFVLGKIALFFFLSFYPNSKK